MKPRHLLYLIIVVCTQLSTNAQTDTACYISKKITYHSAQAGEVYLIWGINYWHTPPSDWLPHNSFIKNNYAYTPLTRSGDNFSTTISVTCNTRLDYYFWVPRNNKGGEVEGWDTNKDNNYFTINNHNENIDLTDAHLQFYKVPFSMISKGKLFLIATFLFLLIAIAWYRKRRLFHIFNLLPGFLIAACVFVAVARFEIAGLKDISFNLGVLFPDLAWLAILFCITLVLYFVFKNKPGPQKAIGITYGVLLFITVLISLLNIEVVKQLGTPFNYKWLYYSDFLKGNDAQVGAAKTLTLWYLKNLAALLIGFIFLSISLAITFSQLRANYLLRMVSYLLGITCLLASYLCYHTINVKPARVQTPFFAFINSLIDPPGKGKLAKMPVPDSVKNYFKVSALPKHSMYDSLHSVDNIIFFVSESTPARYISVYDSSYNCTPSLKKWRAISRQYENMYAHIPSTPNSMLSLLSGIYPMIDYRSALLEKIQLPKPSLPQLLSLSNWKTSLFFSSNLDYAGMRTYAAAQGFETIEDNRSIACQNLFNTTKSNIDGLDDSCMVNGYLNWLAKNQGSKTFSLLWTNQTHNPYYSNTNNPYSTNETLNRYLNALHHTDQVFDKLMTSLQRSEQLNKTLVIFLADHGEAFNTHDQKLHASRIYEENVHIPCIFYNPLLFNGSQEKKVYGMLDLAPTVAHILGIDKPSTWQGSSMVDKGAAPKRSFFVSPYTDLIMGTRYGNWKYIYNVDTEEEELFDLTTDPGELNNKKQAFPQIAKQEKEMLAGWLQFVDGTYKRWSKTKN